jgi:hypothetical protein
VLYERELDVINSEILKRKYAHERLIDINYCERNRRETMQQCNPKGLLITGEKLEEEQLQTVKKFVFFEPTDLVKSDITNLLF